MKTIIKIFYKKNKKTGEILDIQSIDDQYDEVQVKFTDAEVSVDDLKKLGYGTATLKDWVGKLVIDGYFYIQSEAKDIPSFGNIVCGTQDIDVELDESKIGV